MIRVQGRAQRKETAPNWAPPNRQTAHRHRQSCALHSIFHHLHDGTVAVTVDVADAACVVHVCLSSSASANTANSTHTHTNNQTRIINAFCASLETPHPPFLPNTPRPGVQGASATAVDTMPLRLRTSAHTHTP